MTLDELAADRRDRAVQRVIIQQIESAANLVSGLNEHGLANQLWRLAGERKRALEEA